MEALLPVFVAVLLAEMGGRTQIVANGLSVEGTSQQLVFFGLISAASLNLAFGAVGGAVIATMIAFDARSLLFGLALVFAGLPMLLRVRSYNASGRASGLLAAVIRFAKVQFGDASQFIVFAVAARTGQPALALVGGLLGILVATTPAILLRSDWPGRLPLRRIRTCAAAVLTLAGAWAAISALRLI